MVMPLMTEGWIIGFPGLTSYCCAEFSDLHFGQLPVSFHHSEDVGLLIHLHLVPQVEAPGFMPFGQGVSYCG